MKMTRKYTLTAVVVLAAALATQAPAATPIIDFDGNGYGDLAIGARGATVNGMAGAGNVTVLYGSATGLSSAGRQLWDKHQGTVPGDATAHDHFGSALAAGDFNNDGFTDLAIGVPGYRRPSGFPDDPPSVKGSVIVLYGSPGGLIGTHNWCGIPCVPQPKVFTLWMTSQTDDLFGSSLVAGKFDSDNYVDLAIGAPGANEGPEGAGAVRILHGSANGLTETNAVTLSYGPFAESFQQFGYALAAGNFSNGTTMDLAVGIPYKWSSGGAVRVYHVSTSGSFSSYYDWTQSQTNFPAFENHDTFGFSLAAGRFRSGSYDDLAIGIPGKTVAGQFRAGAVMVLNGGSTGLTKTGGTFWSLDTSGVAGEPEPNACFGASLAAGNFAYDTPDDLAIGVPGLTVSGMPAAGGVSILYGSTTGLMTVLNQLIWYPAPEQDAHYGGSVSAARLGGGYSYIDLAVGMPDKDMQPLGLINAGRVLTYYGNANGITTLKSIWGANSPETGAQFGAALSK
jgi:hypothetical protein